MDPITQKIMQADGYESHLVSFLSEETPKGSILFCHGMTEHVGRYENFAHFLNVRGYDFYCYNHRGHGLENQTEALGYIAEKDGHQLILRDCIHIANWIQEHKRTKDFFLMGHSFGSLAVRNVIQYKDDFTGVIISGTANPDYGTILGGLFLARCIEGLHGPKYCSPLVERLNFGSKPYRDICTATPSDWLTKDTQVVAAYRADPLCGFPCSISFYRTLLAFCLFGKQKKKISRTRKDLPLYFISGACDPVGGSGKQVTSIVHTFQDTGFSNVTCTLYPGDRHELLNETDKEEVMSDLVHWMDHTSSLEA